MRRRLDPNKFMDVKKVFLTIFILYVVGFASHALYLKKTVYGDGVFYYSWLRSIVVDRDLDFRNEYKTLGLTQPLLPSGLPGNKYTVGPPILWSVAFIWLYSLIRGDGFGFPYQFTVGFTSMLVALSGLVLLFRLLSQYFSPKVSLLTTLATAFATNLFFYGSLDPVNSHAASFFAATVFLTFLLSKQKNWFLIGLSLGGVGLMRTQDLIYGFLLIPYWKSLNKMRLFTGLIVGFLPQLVAWQALYGKFWTSPYLSHIEGFNLFMPHILGVLFSVKNGLFLWTPITLLGLVGLLASKFDKWLKVIPILAIYVVSTWSTWWQGASYSGRMFVSMLPLFALGLGHVFSWLWSKGLRETYLLLAIIIPLSMINMLLIVYFLLIT